MILFDLAELEELEIKTIILQASNLGNAVHKTTKDLTRNTELIDYVCFFVIQKIESDFNN